MKRRYVIILVLTALAGTVVVGGLYVTGQIGGKRVYTTGNGAIDGYDPVAYFTEGAAVQGSEAHTIKWKNSTWRFTNESHRDMFEADPEKYAPQFGGHCAYGLSSGYLAPIDPQAWTIHQGLLFLNFDSNVMENWRETKEQRIPLAQENWAKM